MVDILNHKHSSEDVDFEGVKSRFCTSTRRACNGRAWPWPANSVMCSTCCHCCFTSTTQCCPVMRATRCLPVCGLRAERRTLTVAQALAGNFTYHSVMEETLPIHAIYLMGSTGTVAHTEGSDFDLWLCQTRRCRRRRSPICNARRATSRSGRSIQDWRSTFFH